MRILVVEDQPDHLVGDIEVLKRAGHMIDFADTRLKAMALLHAFSYDVAVVDLILIQSSGDTVVAEAMLKGVGVVVTTAATDPKLEALKDSLELMNCEMPKTVLRKPFSPIMLEVAVREAYQHRRSPITQSLEKQEQKPTQD
jgi:DNA-binding response OmpR family regulator